MKILNNIITVGFALAFSSSVLAQEAFHHDSVSKLNPKGNLKVTLIALDTDKNQKLAGDQVLGGKVSILVIPMEQQQNLGLAQGHLTATGDDNKSYTALSAKDLKTLDTDKNGTFTSEEAQKQNLPLSLATVTKDNEKIQFDMKNDDKVKDISFDKKGGIVVTNENGDKLYGKTVSLKLTSQENLGLGQEPVLNQTTKPE